MLRRTAAVAVAAAARMSAAPAAAMWGASAVGSRLGRRGAAAGTAPLAEMLPGHGVRKAAKEPWAHARTEDGCMLLVQARRREWLGSRRAAQAKELGWVPAYLGYGAGGRAAPPGCGEGVYTNLELLQRDVDDLQRAAGFRSITTRRVMLSVGGPRAGASAPAPEDDSNAPRETLPVLVQRVDREPWSDRIRNVEFMHAPDGLVVTKPVPLRLLGEEDSLTLRRGAYIHVVEKTIKLTCKVEDLPPYVTLDVSKCRIGQKFLLDDLVARLPEGVKLATNALPEGTLRSGTVSVALCLGKRRLMKELAAEEA